MSFTKRVLFKELPVFERVHSTYLDDEQFRDLQQTLLANPEAGDVIEGTGGLRKLRHADPRRGKGKRGGLRVIWYWWSTEATMKKRNLFAELGEGFDALAQEHEGKLTLRGFEAEAQPAPILTAQDVLRVREQLQISRPVFARYLRTIPRTLENWEQGRAKPNAQAALLIRLVARYPDTVQRPQTV